jgi:hypothetical protein
MRWFLLIAFNFAGWFALAFKSVYIDHHQGPSAIDISIGLPLSLPLLAPVLYFQSPGYLIGTSLFLNPFLWALMADSFLCRFVDPPGDAPQESPETPGTTLPRTSSEIDR